MTALAPVTLVTGGARRVGREIALTLAARGHDLALHAHRLDEAAEDTCAAVRALGRRCELFGADFADEAATAALVPAALAAFGRLDGVVHNASLFVHDDVASFDYAKLSAHACVNTGSAVLLARALHAHLGARAARGALVLLLDQRLWNPNPDYLSYALSKAGLELLVRTLAKSMAPALRVVGVAPGLALGSPLIDEALLQQLAARSLTGRTVQPAEIAETVAFALGNAAFTGSTLMVDAGYHLQPMARDFPFL
ncbi:MAG TPA: SDR family oxidoreductase [Methylibium sp.]|nr:SDR family oxidoreductase [Methylibium sp.]